MSSVSHLVETVDYDRTKLRIRLLHIGFGAFAKAHVLVFHVQYSIPNQLHSG